eukprot:TsM_000356300 transcript=TsM_000356300 gene=TsM_000356300
MQTQRSLSSLTRLSQRTDGFCVGCQIYSSVFLPKRLHAVIHQSGIKVTTTKVRITTDSLHLKFFIPYGYDGHIEGAATQIEDEHVPLTVYPLVQTIGKSSCHWLTDDAHHIQARYFASISRRLALTVMETRRYCDNCICHSLVQISLRCLLHLKKHHRLDLLCSELFCLTAVLHFDLRLSVRVHHLEWPAHHITLHGLIVEATSDQTLHIIHRIFGVHGSLDLRSITDAVFVVHEDDVTRCFAVVVTIGDGFDLATLRNCQHKRRQFPN